MIVFPYNVELVYGIVMLEENISVPWGSPFHDPTFPHIFVVQTNSHDEKKLQRCVLWGSSVPLYYHGKYRSDLCLRIERSFNYHEWSLFCCQYKVGNSNKHRRPQWQRISIADSHRLPRIQTRR